MKLFKMYYIMVKLGKKWCLHKSGKSFASEQAADIYATQKFPMYMVVEEEEIHDIVNWKVQ